MTLGYDSRNAVLSWEHVKKRLGKPNINWIELEFYLVISMCYICFR